jgi:hypothetical protein
LAWELLLPFAIFGPRKIRLAAAAAFTLFQLLNIATANYGFFCYLALALHVFLLDDSDVEWLRRGVLSKWRRLSQRFSRLRRSSNRLRLWRRLCARWVPRGRPPATRRQVAQAVVFCSVYVTVSAHGAMRAFWSDPPELGVIASFSEAFEPFRIINVYHLFGHITRSRYEPQFQIFDGSRWTELDFHYKPGPVERAPPFVAPHQPRVDFLLWFYGLGVRFGQPPFVSPPLSPDYVSGLLQRLCTDPEAAQPLFVQSLPPAPAAVRIVFWDYHFTSAQERRQTGAWWKRTLVTQTPAWSCRPEPRAMLR